MPGTRSADLRPPNVCEQPLNSDAAPPSRLATPPPPAPPVPRSITDEDTPRPFSFKANRVIKVDDDGNFTMHKSGKHVKVSLEEFAAKCRQE